MAVTTVSLCVIAYNEETYLPSLLSDLLNQTYPHEKTEIVLVDGISQDRTKAVMEAFAAEHQEEYISIKVRDNPKRIQAAGWNVAIDTSTCDVLIRIDAHTHIPPEFTALNMRNLSEGEYVSGGVRPCLSANTSKWGNVLLEAENSFFGSSVNISRRGKRKEYVKTLFHAAYRREIFDKVGRFSEDLLRTEDNEMHYRIRQAGYRFCFDPEIVSYQYARSSLVKMLRQKYGNGYWVGLTMGVCPGCISLFNLIPFAFLVGIIVTTVLALCGIWQLAAALWIAYGIFILMGTISYIASGKANVFLFLFPFLLLMQHLAYGAGTLVGLVKMPFWRKKNRSEKGKKEA